MKRTLIALAIVATAAPIAPAIAGDQLVGYYSPDVARAVSGQPIFASDAHRENEAGLTLAQPAGLPAALTQLRGVNLDGLARQNGRFVFSIDVAAVVAGNSLLPGDVVRCDNAVCSNITLLLDATTDLPRHINVDGVGFDRSNGDLLYSIAADANYAGTGFLATDIVRFNGTTHGLAFNGMLLRDGVNVDGLDGTSEGFLFSTDVAVPLDNPAGSPTPFVRNRDVVAFNSSTGVFSFSLMFQPSGNWDGANLDALYGGTLAEADRIFADGFEAL